MREVIRDSFTKQVIVTRLHLLAAAAAALPLAFSGQPPSSQTELRNQTELQNVAEIAARIRSHATRPASAGYKSAQVTIPDTTVSYPLVAIPAGDFLLGSPDSDLHHQTDEQPQHHLHINAFWMQAHEVTWDEYRLFMFAGQSASTGTPNKTVDGVTRPTRPYADMTFGMGTNGYPAISMTQHAANKYAEWLSAKTGEFYRLPTEAEWEYACRAGTTTSYFFGSDAARLGDYAWFKANSGGKYRKVASRKANPWGLFDMLGNVMEWTLDQYAPYNPGDRPMLWAKPSAPYPLAVRGGSWADPAEDLRCAARVPSDPSWKRQDPQLPKSIWYETDAPWLGFRLIRPEKLPSAKEMYAYWNNGVEHDEQ